ncbi:MAG: hypothetical protein ACTIA3_09300 [Corynebacterium casei]|jgi:uncharacterized membrane protein|uniref:DUF2273 domain-containing protein n=2 Tax=Corynebacterium casei TaxID=160386 RepID=G7I005_9CORY|nr:MULTISPECIES: hypothetical protein [Corynebacterium]AHI19133.1 hypothetical protein CCASEI_02750 [Corynebacterium casei LMG S-19264]MDN5705644.1 hypothetical protein [Corynebacterium casei]MDN5728674.1 hypothetical protein [Corynebacterium casei]MDN5739608.1 hypothetical protein [Corynebacterium casei]MDN5784202.1 hypothetical protein [Corynebacterium casei]
MKNYTYIGVALGIILAIAIMTNAWPLFFLAVILGAVGGVIGAHFDGRINLGEIWNNVVGKGRG